MLIEVILTAASVFATMSGSLRVAHLGGCARSQDAVGAR